jgi:hypothetical protein
MSLAGKNKSKHTKIRLFIAIAFAGFSILLYVLFPLFQREKGPKYLRIKGPYFYPVEISEFSSARIPCIQIIAEGKAALVQVDLGTDDMNLPSEFLQNMSKKFIQRELFCGLRGKKYESDFYELPKITIGNVSIFSVKVSETNLEFEKDATLASDEEKPSGPYLGRIGWKAFYGMNVLLDCEHSILAFCDSMDTLKKEGYPTEHFIEVPFLLNRGLIEFDAMTEKGLLRCVLDTGCTWSLLNKDLEGASNDHMILNPNNIDPEHYQLSNPDNADLMVFDPEEIYKISAFKIGGKDFGTMSFLRVKMPAQIDALIGMDFIDSTLIFIDFINRKMYFYEYPPEEEHVAVENI